jgi:glutathione S-transferase
MTEIVVHGVPGSPYVRMPLLTCEEKGVGWRLVPLPFGGSRMPEHLARQPFGRVPAIEHGDFRLYEVQAIVRYIDQAFDGPSLTPADPKRQARMNQVMNIMDWYVMPSIAAGIGFNRLIKPKFGMPVDEAAITAALPMARTCIQALEEILAGKPYFAGDQVSLADIMAFAHLDFFVQTPESADMLAGSPLLGWIEHMAARPSVAATSWARLDELAAA